ncbi:type II toxin-antitoxin system HicB family antitoxin [Phormidesmis sp. 146-12]
MNQDVRQVILYRDEDGIWIVECLSLKGCISQGKTKEEALFNIREAIVGYIAALEDGLSIPEDKFETFDDTASIRYSFNYQWRYDRKFIYQYFNIQTVVVSGTLVLSF